jgi:predicted lipid-binding transport protein (Tim44 family)
MIDGINPQTCQLLCSCTAETQQETPTTVQQANAMHDSHPFLGGWGAMVGVLFALVVAGLWMGDRDK